MTLTAIIKALRFLWPFIREMFFAGKSLKQVLVENKFVVCLIVILVGSMLLNYLSFSKLYEIALARREDDGPTEVHRNKPPEKPVATQPLPPASTPSSAKGKKTQVPHENVRHQLEEIYGEQPK